MTNETGSGLIVIGLLMLFGFTVAAFYFGEMTATIFGMGCITVATLGGAVILKE